MEEMTKKYESVVIFNPQIDESAVKADVEKLVKLIESKGGRNINADFWGKKEIAYPVKKFKYGNFVALNFESENSDLNGELTSMLRIYESVIKFQTHRLGERRRKYKGNLKFISSSSESGGDNDIDDLDL
jgi:small subunit ribosomal protein S6